MTDNSTDHPSEEEKKYHDIEQFLTDHGIKLHRKKIRDLMTFNANSMAVYKGNIIISSSCRKMDIELGMSTYRDIKSRNLSLGQDSYSNLLSLVAGLGEIGNGHVGPTRDEVIPPHNLAYAIEVYTDMKNKGLKVTEAGYTAMIRCYCINHQREEALELYKLRYEGATDSAATDNVPESEPVSLESDSTTPVTVGILPTESTAATAVEDGSGDNSSPSINNRAVVTAVATVDKYWVTKTKEASILANATSRSTPKLRTFYPLLLEYASAPHFDLSTCLYLWNQMVVVHDVFPSEREFIVMFQLLVSLREKHEAVSGFASGSGASVPPLKDSDMSSYMTKSDYTAADIEALFYYLLALFNDHLGAFHLTRLNTVYAAGGEMVTGSTEAAVESVTVTDAGAGSGLLGVDVMRQWFELFTHSSNITTDGNNAVSSKGYTIYPSVSVTTRQGQLDIDHALSSSSSSSSCPYQLTSVDIATPMKELLLDQITSQLTMGVRKAPLGNKPVNNKLKHVPRTASKSGDEERKLNDWTSFMGWLDNQLALRAAHDPTASADSFDAETTTTVVSDGPLHTLPVELNIPPYYSIVLDGANIGYYKMNYAGAPAHLDYFQLHTVVMYLLSIGHYPLVILHARHTFNNNLPAYNTDIGRKIRNLLKFWKAQNILYITPSGSNDDWYWLYASVKLNLQVITNDEMRDHLFKMLNLRYFTQWKERHQIHFEFGRWIRAAKQSESYQTVLRFIASSPQMDGDTQFNASPYNDSKEICTDTGAGTGGAGTGGSCSKRVREESTEVGSEPTGGNAGSTDADENTKVKHAKTGENRDEYIQTSGTMTKLLSSSNSVPMYDHADCSDDSDIDTGETTAASSDDELRSYAASRFVDLKIPSLYSLRNQADTVRNCYYFPIILEQNSPAASTTVTTTAVTFHEQKHVAHVVKPFDASEVDLDQVRWLCCVSNQ